MTIQTSHDGSNFNDVSQITSAGNSEGLIEYPLVATGVSHVRIVCNGNNDPSNAALRAWNNFTEIEIWGR